MGLKVVGAGVGRTGTFSIKNGLETLLGSPCYHMHEVFQHPEHVSDWHSAARGKAVDWDRVFVGYEAAVDWPASAFWPELSQQYPESIIVLSRRDPEAWWESASSTIFKGIPHLKDSDQSEWYEMVMAMMETRFTTELESREACLAALKRHEDFVLQTAPKDRLVVWEARDGWGPLCEALNLPIPAEDFPRVNTREEFLARIAEREEAGKVNA